MTVVVTGGGGFLGRRIAELLIEDGRAVRSVSRGEHAELAEAGIEHVRADLADERATAEALEGAEAVVHTAAKTGVWGPRGAFERANVDATRNVLSACREHGIPRLVYTSSPSVCFDGRDHAGARELPYARRFLAWYPQTKARAEREVLAANGAELATVALRPHLVFGPRDPHLIPRIVERASARKLAIVGRGRNEVSLTYVDNAAWAHVDALRALEEGEECAGKAYFIANEAPVPLWGWINALLAQLGKPLVTSRIPLGMAWVAGATAEAVWKTFRREGEPPMTRFVALQLARTHTYDVGRAKEELGYVERVDMEEGTRELVRSLGAGEPGSGL